MGLCFGDGISVLYITMSAGQSGTTLRATAAIAIPNLVRSCLPLILLLFQFFRIQKIFGDYITAAWVTVIIVIAIGFLSALYAKETFGRDLDFAERQMVHVIPAVN